MKNTSLDLVPLKIQNHSFLNLFSNFFESFVYVSNVCKKNNKKVL